MANLPESATWDAGVYQIETTDPVLGGPNGTSNVPLKNLANRTFYLKQMADSLSVSKAPLHSPALTGTPTAPTAAAGTNTTQVATTEFVKTAVADGVAGLVTSVAGKTGAVTLAVADISGAAPLASPALTGTPTAPTPAVGSNTTQVATAAFVTAAIAATPASVSSVAGKTGAVTLAVADISGAAPLASPALTGTPTAPTATTGDSTTKIATTAFVSASIVAAGSTTVTNASPAAETVGATAFTGVNNTAARADHLHAMPGEATTASPGFMSAMDKTKLNSIQVGAQANTISSVAGKTGAVTLAVADISGAAPLASPALTGTPTAPTATTGDSTTKIATTAFVSASIVAAGSTTVTNASPAAETVGDTGAVGIATTAARADHRHAMPAAATTAVNGFMSATDKAKLDGIQVGAQANTISSVAGKTGAVILAVADISGAAPLASPALTGTPTAPTATAGDSTTKIATTAFVNTAAETASPAGMVAHFARNTAPAGWLKANGATVSRATYAALFASIGTTFGLGDGSTTFKLPDLRGEFIRGWDDGRSVDSLRVFGSTQTDEFKSHSHLAPTSNGGNVIPNGYQVSPPNLYPSDFIDAAETSAVGSNETRPRNIALLACIKY